MYEIMMSSTTTTTSNEMDEIIENEVCNRLIRLSCAKMVNSKHERGGAKLHRNLLILHLLRRARDEQQRSAPPSPNGSDEHLEISTRSTQAVIESSLRDADDSDNEEEGDDDDDDVDVERCDKEKGQLLDLSRGPRSGLSTSFNEPIELSVRDEDEIDYCNLRLEPLQLPFGTDAIEAEDLSELSKPSVLVVPQLSPELSCQVGQELSELQAVHQHQPIAVVNRASPVMEQNSDSDESAPLYFEISEDEHDPTSSSSESEDDDYEEEEDEIDRNTKSPTKMRRRRKRRTSSPPITAKKCCVEERQLTGLISVFNSGLSVVADQFMGHPPSGTLLQQSPDQIVPSLMRIACNPLICQ